MVNNDNSAIPGEHSFVFHGKGWPFFKICLINLLLTIITLGIYLPWAFVKSRRYIYENTELNGVRFGYNASGSVFFVSWLLIGVLLIIGSFICSMISPALSSLPVLVLAIVMPLLAVQGLRYQALMTTLNNVRFGFNCGRGQAMWVMLILPLLLGIGAALIITVCISILPTPETLSGIYTHVTVLILLVLLAMGVVNGIVYAKWMQLLGNNASFGLHRFSVTVSVRRSIVINIVSMLIMIPFIFVIGSLMGSLLMALMAGAASGGIDPQTSIDLMDQYQGQIGASYLLYFAAILLMSVFAMSALRNLFINGLRLEDKLTFRSTITFVGLLMQVLVLSFASIFTLGLAYPWAKMRMMRYLASCTFAVGNLDSVELKDSDEKPDTGFFAAIGSGTMPALPFI